MSNIRLLTKEVRELIAAGEVVERPASVVKELVENAIDAGGTSIEVEIRRSGLESIRVTDNGSGMAREEVPLAVTRHATSKVSSPQDLLSIETLGFRGEALAAIAAVSRLRIVTRTPREAFASEYCFEGGEETGFQEIGAPQGTSIVVSDLFYNTPARMKFLKKDASEAGAVQTITEQIALSHPEIAFKLIREGKTVFSAPGDGDLYSTIYSILPREVAQNMIEVSPIEELVGVWGYMTVPQAARASRSLQYVFVNGRFIKSRSISAAAEEACKNLLMQGKHPSFVLNVSMPYEDLDVNVHPAKTEVRFRNDRAVFSAVYAAVKLAVGDYAGSLSRQLSQPSIQNDRDTAGGVQRMDETQDMPAEGKDSTSPAPREWQNKTQPDTARSFLAYTPDDQRREQQLQLTLEQASMAYEATKYKKIDIEYSESRPVKEKSMHEGGEQPVHKIPTQLRVIGELFGTYIVAQLNELALLIDKHAAHERILFEQLNAAEGGIDRQLLLEPVVVAVSTQEAQELLDNGALLEKLGFFLEAFGPGEVLVREIPVYLQFGAAADAVLQIADQLVHKGNEVSAEQTEWLLHSVSCRAAIKAGHKTSEDEMIRLATAILDSDIPKYCPHGRPVYIILEQRELEKRFGRIQG